jgi:RsiW-degrading membrane proteinase PrsW (M82 family)
MNNNNNNNIYLELELFLDPPVTDVETLKKELNNKIGDWNKMMVSSPKFKSRVARARQFIKDGLPRITEQATEAQTKKLKQLHYAIQQQKYAGKIGENGFKKLKELFPCFSETTIQQESGFSDDSTFKPPVIPPSLKCDRAIPAIEMESIQADLAIVENNQYADFYEFLGMVNNEKSKTKELYQKARDEEEKNRRVVVKTPEVDAKNRLLGKAAQYFKDDYERLNYDVALQRSIFNKLCQESFQHRAIKGIITTEIYDQSINDAVLKGFTRQEAEYLVYEYYCIKMKCPPPIAVDISRPKTFSVSKNWKDAFKDLFSNPATKQQPQQQKTMSTSISETKSLTVDEEPTLLLESFHFDTVQNAVKPIDETNLPMILKDRVFWCTSLLCITPLGITALRQEFLDVIMQFVFMLVCLVGILTVFGQLLRRVILRTSESVWLPVAAFFVTSFICVPTLLLSFGFLPQAWLISIIEIESPLYQFLRSIFLNGVLEEICKIIPVLIYLLYYRQKASMKMIFLIGFLSSLGWSAGKFFVAIISPAPDVEVQNVFSVFTVDLHTTSLLVILASTIANAIWTAIFAYYLSCAVIAGNQWWKFVLLGLVVSSCLHGVYLWLSPGNPGLATILIFSSFVLFYSYLTKIRNQIVLVNS